MLNILAEEVDIVENAKEAVTWAQKFVEWMIPYLIGFGEIIVILFISKKLSGYIVGLVKKALVKAKVDKGVTSFVCSLTRILLGVVTILIVLSIVGVSTTSFATAIGASGLAIGLGFQGTLQNLAGGLLILIMKPFEVGQYIIASGLEGYVLSIDICYTKLRTIDNKIVVLPNGALSNTNLVNISREEFRRIDIILPISYSDDIRSVRRMINNILIEDKRLCKEKENDIVVDSFGDSSINIAVHTWVRTPDYWTVRWDLIEKFKYGMDENGFTIPFNQVDLHVVEGEKEVKR